MRLLLIKYQNPNSKGEEGVMSNSGSLISGSSLRAAEFRRRIAVLEARLFALISAVSCSVIEISKEREVIFVNDAAKVYLKSRNDVDCAMGAIVLDLFPDEQSHDLYVSLKEAENSRETMVFHTTETIHGKKTSETCHQVVPIVYKNEVFGFFIVSNVSHS